MPTGVGSKAFRFRPYVPTMRYIIQAVREREHYVRYLLDRLPTAEVYWDDQYNDLAALEAIMRLAGSEPFVRLEDDAILCRDFPEQVARRVQEAPEKLHQLFSSYGDRKLPDGYSIFAGRYFQGGLAYYAPEWLPAPFADYIAEVRRIPMFRQDEERMRRRGVDEPGYHNILRKKDGLLSTFLHERNRETYLQWHPSLVQHRLGMSVTNKGRFYPYQTPHFINDPPWEGQAFIGYTGKDYSGGQNAILFRERK